MAEAPETKMNEETIDCELFQIREPDVPEDLTSIRVEGLNRLYSSLAGIAESIAAQLAHRRERVKRGEADPAFMWWRSRAIMKLSSVQNKMRRIHLENQRRNDESLIRSVPPAEKVTKPNLYALLATLGRALTEWPDAPQNVRDAAKVMIDALSPHLKTLS
jgi:hypothetical protein